MGLYAPELLLLVSIDVFLVLSLLTCLLEREFATPIPYLLQLAALVGFGQIYVSKEFLDVFSQDLRFWYSLSYLIATVASVFASNLYIMVVRRELAKGFLFSGSVTAPAVIFSMFFVSVYTHDIEVPLDFFPRIPLSYIPLAVTLSLGLLVLGIFLSAEPNLLQRLRVGRGVTVSTKETARPAVKAADEPTDRSIIDRILSYQYRVDFLRKLRTRGRRRQGPEVPLSTLTDQQQVLEEEKEKKEVKE